MPPVSFPARDLYFPPSALIPAAEPIPPVTPAAVGMVSITLSTIPPSVTGSAPGLTPAFAKISLTI